jgi:hypothetical protein
MPAQRSTDQSREHPQVHILELSGKRENDFSPAVSRLDLPMGGRCLGVRIDAAHVEPQVALGVKRGQFGETRRGASGLRDQHAEFRSPVVIDESEAFRVTFRGVV